VVKFSTQFICKATGQRVNISRMTMSRTHPGGKYEHDLSTDPAHPTTFQVDPLHPTDCYRKMDCAGHQHAPDFRLYMDADQAPESCGSFYWDPLVHAVAGDGFGASAIASGSDLLGTKESRGAPRTAKPSACVLAVSAAAAALGGVWVSARAKYFSPKKN
jgi:hypothetical protein